MTLKERRKLRREKKNHKEVIVRSEKKNTDLSEISFINRNARLVKLIDFVGPDEIWPFEVKRGQSIKTKFVLSYEAVKKVAHEAGISISAIDYKVTPSNENRMSRDLVIQLICQSCPHKGFQNKEKNCIFPKVGEASDENTNGISRAYKATMAEKRGFVRGVIEHLRLPNMYGEEEFSAEEEKEESKIPKPSELKELSEIINEILNAKNEKTLQKVGRKLKTDSTRYTSLQINYLRELYGKRLTQLTANF